MYVFRETNSLPKTEFGQVRCFLFCGGVSFEHEVGVSINADSDGLDSLILLTQNARVLKLAACCIERAVALVVVTA